MADDLSRPEMDSVVEETFAAQNLELHTDAEWKALRQQRNDAQNLAKLETARREAAQDRLKAFTSITYDRAIKTGLNPDALIGTKVHASIESYNKLAEAADATAASLGQNASALRASGKQGASPLLPGAPITGPMLAAPNKGRSVLRDDFVDLAANGESYVNLLLSPEGQPIARLNPDLLIEQELPHDLVLTVQMRPLEVGRQAMWECLLCGNLVLSQEQHQRWHESILVKNFDLYTEHVTPLGPTIEEYPA